MIFDSILIIAGVALVIYGADRLTAGASALARRMNIPEIIIGLTIVAAGTSAPEFFVSFMSAIKGTPDMAVGNVVGSNIFNVLLIVGVTAMVAPISVTRTTVGKDMIWAIIASVLFLMCCFGNTPLSFEGCVLGRTKGFVLLLFFALFMRQTLMEAKVAKSTTEDKRQATKDSAIKNVLLFIAGLAMLIFGSNIFVDSASSVAASLGISQGVIGLTIVAGGTSLPELATSVVAAKKGNSAIAIGNVIGSNVFNILAILGTTAAICPMELHGITPVDIIVMGTSIFLLWLFSYTKLTVTRWEGAVLTSIFVLYMTYLLINI
ncbi:MAG: calcium/sodium antiporter [Prevotella sp.]|nr:calcium/sodium antiporter [Prevotella sp.]MDD5896308.1 calcium/sodium antiporter [Prevotellaceae bacterium]